MTFSCVSSSPRSPAGLRKLCRTDTGIPAVDPGVKMTKSAFAFSCAIRSGAIPDEARPFCHVVAVSRAACPTVSSLRSASAGSTRLEFRGTQARKCQEEVAEVSFGVDCDDRNAVHQGFFDEVDG